MSQNSTIQRIARVTIEFTTAFHVGSGAKSGASDAGVVCDANGLPTLPGSSIQGVLRQLCEDIGMPSDDWFGFGAEKRHAVYRNGRASRFAVSWGLIHNRQDRPVEGLVCTSVIEGDEVLRNAANPMVRDHVRMTHRKVADVEAYGKFDERAVAAGHRFTFELQLQSTGAVVREDDGKWLDILGLLSHPCVRLGGKIRRGFGNFKVVRMIHDRFDLSRSEDRARFLAWPVRLADVPSASGGALRQDGSSTLPFVDYTLRLKPETPWMIGGGVDKSADSAPVRATRIAWAGSDGGDHGREIEAFLIPGSSIKGALAHRTCFHANRLAGVFANQSDGADTASVTHSNNGVVRMLFGEMVDHEEEAGNPGRIMVDDFYLTTDTAQLAPQNHVAINPFTGGAKDTALFQDRPLVGGELLVPIFFAGSWQTLDECEIINGKRACPKVAFEAALADLCEGRLAIGAHASRGYGFMTGNFETLSTPTP